MVVKPATLFSLVIERLDHRHSAGCCRCPRNASRDGSIGFRDRGPDVLTCELQYFAGSAWDHPPTREMAVSAAARDRLAEVSSSQSAEPPETDRRRVPGATWPPAVRIGVDIRQRRYTLWGAPPAARGFSMGFEACSRVTACRLAIDHKPQPVAISALTRFAGLWHLRQVAS
jgi:hypothetical protein